jgi:hypothetical protein
VPQRLSTTATGALRIATRATAAALLTLVVGCGSGKGGDEATLIEGVQRLEAQVRTLAHADGCTSVNDCKSAAMGVKACGGPVEYVVYCTRSTDEPQLLAKLREYAAAQAEYNKAVGVVSDCLYVLPPNLELDNGVCRAAGR